MLIRCLQGLPIDPVEFYETMAAEDQCIIGTPEHVMAKMERYADVGLDHLMCLTLGGPSLSQEKIVKSIKLMGEKVLPRFHESRSRVF